MMYYELSARYDHRQSFYGKAHIKETPKYYTLISYDTEILKLDKTTGKITFLCKDEWAFSQTTNRHINEFFKQYTNERAKSKKRAFSNGNGSIRKGNIMKAFTTISELDILYEAYCSILAKWVRAEEDYSKSILTGFPNEISKYHRDRYHGQLDELHQEILKLENEKQQKGARK